MPGARRSASAVAGFDVDAPQQGARCRGRTHRVLAPRMIPAQCTSASAAPELVPAPPRAARCPRPGRPEARGTVRARAWPARCGARSPGNRRAERRCAMARPMPELVPVIDGVTSQRPDRGSAPARSPSARSKLTLFSSSPPRAISLRMNLRLSSMLSATGSSRDPARRLTTSGSRIVSWISALSVAWISRGVPFGPRCRTRNGTRNRASLRHGRHVRRKHRAARSGDAEGAHPAPGSFAAGRRAKLGSMRSCTRTAHDVLQGGQRCPCTAPCGIWRAGAAQELDGGKVTRLTPIEEMAKFHFPGFGLGRGDDLGHRLLRHRRRHDADQRRDRGAPDELEVDLRVEVRGLQHHRHTAVFNALAEQGVAVRLGLDDGARCRPGRRRQTRFSTTVVQPNFAADAIREQAAERLVRRARRPGHDHLHRLVLRRPGGLPVRPGPTAASAAAPTAPLIASRLLMDSLL